MQQTRLFHYIRGRGLSFAECKKLYLGLKKHGERIVYKSIRKAG